MGRLYPRFVEHCYISVFIIYDQDQLTVEIKSRFTRRVHFSLVTRMPVENFNTDDVVFVCVSDWLLLDYVFLPAINNWVTSSI